MSRDERNRRMGNRERILRYLDGGLAGTDRDAVTAELRSEPETRRLLREVAEQAVAVSDEARVEGCRREATGPVPVAPTRGGAAQRSAPWALAAAVAVLLVGGAWVWSSRADTVVTVVDLVGSVRWIGDGGRVVPVREEGRALGGGTVELLSESSAVTLRFDDASEIALAGTIEVTISDQDGAKSIHFEEGDISASIEEQPEGRPFIFHTPTAELRVLGTRFEVQSVPGATHLTVTEGAVRLTRRVDGSSVEVPAEHEARASLDRAETFRPVKRREPVRNWESDLDRGPARAEGVWKPAEEERPARLGTIPKFLPDTHDGAVTIHSVRVPARSADGRSVEFTSDSVVRIRGYLRRPESIEVMLGLNLRKGGWAGNFFHRTKTLPAGPWEIEIPAVYFKKWRYHAKTTPPELTRVRQTVVYTIDTDAGLEIVSVEIAESG